MMFLNIDLIALNEAQKRVNPVFFGMGWRVDQESGFAERRPNAVDNGTPVRDPPDLLLTEWAQGGNQAGGTSEDLIGHNLTIPCRQHPAQLPPAPVARLGEIALGCQGRFRATRHPTQYRHPGVGAA